MNRQMNKRDTPQSQDVEYLVTSLSTSNTSAYQKLVTVMNKYKKRQYGQLEAYRELRSIMQGAPELLDRMNGMLHKYLKIPRQDVEHHYNDKTQPLELLLTDLKARFPNNFNQIFQQVYFCVKDTKTQGTKGQQIAKNLERLVEVLQHKTKQGEFDQEVLSAIENFVENFLENSQPYPLYERILSSLS